MKPVRLAAFASGGGTNVQALIDHESDPSAGYTVALVVSNKADAGVLQRARDAGRASVVIPSKDRTAEEIAGATVEALEAHDIEGVLLAGYLRLVPEAVTEAYAGRILNIHPALLPAFGGKGMYGMRVHEAVLASGASFSGPTVHHVTSEYDEGSIVAQWPVPVLEGDTVDALQARVLRAEHRLYPLVASRLAECIRADRPLAPLRLGHEAFRGSDWDADAVFGGSD